MRRWTKRAGGLAVALALAAASAAMAQKPEHRFGFMGGLNLARLSGAGVEEFDVKNRVGFLAGAFAEIGVVRNFAIEPEIYYTMKGAKATDAGEDLEFKADWLEIPLLAKVLIPIESASKVKVRPHFYAGPAVAFRTSCKVKGESGGVSVEVECDEFDTSVKKTDFSIVFGGGVDIGPVLVGVRYDLGLTDLNDDPEATSEDTIRSRALSFLVGVSFPLGRR